MAKELMNKPGWLETLWNVNPGLAQRAENDLIEWIENGIDINMIVSNTDILKDQNIKFQSRFKKR